MKFTMKRSRVENLRRPRSGPTPLLETTTPYNLGWP